MDITQVTELAKQGGRLASDKQWELADALAQLTDTEITQVAVHSKRNESTLHQYARAAQRWPESDRVQGVSFSAHRVALSWHDPRGLLVQLKHEVGSPTVKQVRRAMGLEGHPAIEMLEKGISKLDRQVSRKALGDVVAELAKYLNELNDDSLVIEQEEDETLEEDDTNTVDDRGTQEIVSEEEAKHGNYYVDNESSPRVEKDEENYQGLGRVTDKDTSKTWTPPISTSDIAGI